MNEVRISSRDIDPLSAPSLALATAKPAPQGHRASDAFGGGCLDPETFLGLSTSSARAPLPARSPAARHERPRKRLWVRYSVASSQGDLLECFRTLASATYVPNGGLPGVTRLGNVPLAVVSAGSTTPRSPAWPRRLAGRDEQVVEELGGEVGLEHGGVDLLQGEVGAEGELAPAEGDGVGLGARLDRPQPPAPGVGEQLLAADVAVGEVGALEQPA